MNSVLKRLYDEGALLIAEDGQVHNARRTGIPPWLAENLYEIVRKHALKSTLEIGMAFGLSSLAICQALRDNGGGCHVAVDPYQSFTYKQAGIHNLERANLADLVELYEQPSHLILPDLVKQKREFDFIFIDGMHLFDYVLLDFFYAHLLVKTGGFLCLDDLQIPAIQTAFHFIKRNMGNFSVVEENERFATIQKLREDERAWYYFKPLTGLETLIDGEQWYQEQQQGYDRGEDWPESIGRNWVELGRDA